MHVTGANRVVLYSIGSHELSSVIAAFNRARGQLPADAVGLIYIDADLSQVRAGDEVVYFDLLAKSIETLFTPTRNTRVGAVVLTAGPLFVPASPQSDLGGSTMVLGPLWPVGIIRNPFADIPTDFTIPAP